MSLTPTAMKLCYSCREVKPVEEYSMSTTAPDGLRARCKPCFNALAKERATENPERELLRSCKRNARTRGIPFSLVLSDIVIPSHCPVLGIKLMRGDGRMIDASPSVDRTDSSKGYVRDNISVVSWKANRLKNNATIDELQKIAAYMAGQQ